VHSQALPVDLLQECRTYLAAAPKPSLGRHAADLDRQLLTDGLS
jgi:hypothetical protein